MRKLLLFTTFAFAASSVAAQQQPAEPAQNGKPAAAAATKKKGESNLERRQRVEGAAGGTAPVPKEERESVGAGAKPHMHFDQIDRGLHRKSDAEVITPAE
jgi:hypothetical protein